MAWTECGQQNGKCLGYGAEAERSSRDALEMYSDGVVKSSERQLAVFGFYAEELRSHYQTKEK